MTDSQNKSAWNDWANYLLYIVKKHDGDIDGIREELKVMGLQKEKISQILSSVEQYRDNIELMEKDIKSLNLNVQELNLNKLTKSDFDDFYAEDYKVFKTQILERAKIKARHSGAIWGFVSAFVIYIIDLLVRLLLL